MKGKKQIIGVFIVILLALIAIWYALTSYKNVQRENHANEVLYGKEEDNKKDDEKEILPWDSKSILVVYFSRPGENHNVGNVKVGNTAMVASYIKEYLDIDSFEILTTKKYPEDYDEMLTLAKKEQKNNERPELKNKIETLDNYDTIFIGYPIWLGDMPMALYTFFESYDLSNKTIIPFNTHEGSGDSDTYNKIKKMLPNSNVITDGLAIKGSIARSGKGKIITINWLRTLGYILPKDLKNMKLEYEVVKDINSFELNSIDVSRKGNELIEKDGNYYLLIKYGSSPAYYSHLEVLNVNIKSNDITISVSLPKDEGTGDAFSYPYAIIKLNKEPDSIKVIYK